MDMRKIALGALSIAVVAALSGCGQTAAPSSSTETASSSSTASSTALANPWSSASSAKEAATSAGLDSFVIPAGTEISLGPLDHLEYRSMKGIAECDAEFPAVSMTIRKGAADEANDISGDYTAYAYTWKQDVGGVEVTCSGNREGAATKSVWKIDGIDYSIGVQGLGGDSDYGLPAADLEILVGSIR